MSKISQPSPLSGSPPPPPLKQKSNASDRVSNAGKTALPKEKTSNKSFKAHVVDSVTKFFKTIRDVFKHIVCCGCLDEDSYSSYASDSSSIKNTNSDPTNPVKKPAAPVKKPAVNVKDPAVILEKMISERDLAENDLMSFALELEKYRSNYPSEPNLLPRPQKSLGLTCYMNAALQCLDASYGLRQSGCNQLVEGSLVRPEGLSLLEFERETLHAWSPIEFEMESLVDKREKLMEKIEKLTEEDVEEFIHLKGALKNIELKIQHEESLLENEELLADKLIQLESTEDSKEKAALNQEILDLNFSVLEKQDQILFKWSYLLLLQAKRYGTENHINKALEYHHNICFAIARGDLKDKGDSYGIRINKPGSSRRAAHDAASYFDIWHDMLGKQVASTRYKEFTYDEEQYVDHIKADPIGTILLYPEGGKDDFMSCVRQHFDAAEYTESGFDAKAAGVPVIVNDFIDHRRFNQSPPSFITFSLKQLDYKNDKRVIHKESIPFSRDDNQNPQGSYSDKLVLDEYFSNKKARYRIISCTEHKGEDGRGGHYIAYVLGNDKKWYECSDKEVKQIAFEKVPFDKARTLTYGLRN